MNPQQSHPASIPLSLEERFLREGLDILGVVSWPPDDPAAEESRRVRDGEWREWLEQGRYAGMDWMESHREAKFDPEAVLPGCRSLIVTAIGYYREDGDSRRYIGSGRVARYARGRDYHKELGNRIRRICRSLKKDFPENDFRGFADIGPLHERWIAESAGIALTGKNTLSIHRQLGSWILLGHVLSTRFFPEIAGTEGPRACPSGCRRCLDSCPTGALEAPYRIDAGKCISYLTIEHKGPVEEPLRAAVGNWVFGCDLCQEVCPFNYRRETTTEQGFLTDYAGPRVDLTEVLQMSDRDEFVSRFAGSPLMRAGRTGLVRNACTAAANNGDAGLLPLLQKLCGDTDPGIRQHARWAVIQLERLNATGFGTETI